MRTGTGLILPLLLFFCIPSLPSFAFRTETLSGYASRQKPEENGIPPIALTVPVTDNRLPLQPQPSPETEKLLRQYKSRFSREAINRTLKASEPYAGFIRQKINEAGLPQELFFIAFIESEFKPRAVSRSGAYGLWQFMRNSIGGYDMNISEWADERFDFMKSTEAALHKLEYNYRQTGDWELAMAAYNCGLGKVTRTMKSSGIRDFRTLAQKRLLPAQTVHYVPKCFAVAYACSNKRDFGLTVSWNPPPEWNMIRLDKPVDISLLAAKADIPPNVLKAANAELNYRITPPNGNYFLKFPAEYTDQITAALDSDDSEFINYYIYKIRQGDTLYALSAHYGVSVDIILQFNPGVRPNTLQIGQKLMIPAFRDVAPPPPPKAAAADTSPKDYGPDTYRHTYTVQSGDTLWGIARKYNISVDELKYFNKMGNRDILKAGSVIRVP